MLLSISASITAQVNLQWVRAYHGDTTDSKIYAQDMVIDRNGFVYVTGFVEDTAKFVRIITIKYSPNGNMEWVQRYTSSNTSWNRPWSIRLDDSSNVYIAGDGIGLLTLKYNSAGVLQWARTFRDGNWGQYAWDVISDDSGNVYTTGITTDKFVTIKYNSDGNLKWIAQDSFAGGLAPSYITLDSLGNVYVTGRGWGKFYTCNTFKYNNVGVKQWEQVYSGNVVDGGADSRGIAIDRNGDIVVMGTSFSIGPPINYSVIKYTPSGSLKWATVYIDPFKSYNAPNAFVIDKSSNVFVTGNINEGNCPTDAFGTIKINASGTVKWNKEYTLGYCNDDIAYDIAVDKNGFIYVTGESVGDSLSNNADIITIKYDQNGKPLWVERYPSILYEEGYKISVQDNGDIYIFGQQFSQNWIPSFITIKYSQWSTGLLEKSKQINWSIYPNPTSLNATLEFDNPSGKKCKLTLYDSYGKIIRTTSDITTNKIEVEKQDLQSGLYFFQLELDLQIIAKGKLIFK